MPNPASSISNSIVPNIRPFHRLVEFVPRGSSVLDVGCGAGLFILFLAKRGWILSAVGFDLIAPRFVRPKTRLRSFLMGSHSLRAS